MVMRHHQPLPPELVDLQVEIEQHAVNHGLDFYPTIFEVVDYDHLSEIAAFGGFPVRYPHWRFGMEYEQLSKGYAYGLQKIYELVINNDPCYAYLLRSNALADQKLVMAHVYGHCDFFKNNAYFAHTNRKMMDEMANHGNRIRRYMDRQGVEEVENFIDACLSIEDLIDPHSTAIRRRPNLPPPPSSSEDQDEPIRAGRFESKPYLDPYVNPPHLLAAEVEKLRQERQREMQFPAAPERDVMLFLIEHAPLRAWQLDTLAIIRDEAYYFAPQAQTKIMNEGWASYWHSKIMTRHAVTAAEIVNYADHHSGTMSTAGGRLNPYKLGIELFRDIEDRFNRGRHGSDFEACDDLAVRRAWNTNEGAGLAKIFEVRRIHNDLTFIDEFLTLDFCRDHKLFSFGYNADAETYEIESREFPKIKQRLLYSLTNRGRPVIQVRDGNYKNRGELFLEHVHGGVDLQLDYARDTLANLQRLWTRPVHLETRLESAVATLSYDGHEHKMEKKK